MKKIKSQYVRGDETYLTPLRKKYRMSRNMGATVKEAMRARSWSLDRIKATTFQTMKTKTKKTKTTSRQTV